MKAKKLIIFFMVIMCVMLIETSYVHADEPTQYYIKVNRAQNCVTVYTLDSFGEYTTPYKAMICSTGIEQDSTPLGVFNISEKFEWGRLVDNSYGQYCSRIVDSIMFHSVPYFSRSKGNLEYEEYNKLGEAASLGCIRLTVADAKWIYENCQEGTTVEIYDDMISPGPLGKPLFYPIPENHNNQGWDPTDDYEENPWRTLTPNIMGVQDITTEGKNVDFFKDIVATDILGNDISNLVKVNGEYNEKESGEYSLTYSVTDSFGYTVEVPFTLKVNIEEITTAHETQTQIEDIKTEKEVELNRNSVSTIIVVAIITFVISFAITKSNKR